MENTAFIVLAISWLIQDLRAIPANNLPEDEKPFGNEDTSLNEISKVEKVLRTQMSNEESYGRNYNVNEEEVTNNYIRHPLPLIRENGADELPVKEITSVRRKSDEMKHFGMNRMEKKSNEFNRHGKKLDNCYWGYGRPSVDYPDDDDTQKNNPANLKQSVRHIKDLSMRTYNEVRKNSNILKQLLTELFRRFPMNPKPAAPGKNGKVIQGE